MFRCVSDLKGLAIDVDSFPNVNVDRWKSLNEKYQCLYLTDDEERQIQFINTYGEQRVFYIEPFEKFWAPNIEVHKRVIQRMALENSEFAYISCDSGFLRRASCFLGGTICVSSIIPYEDADSLADVTVRSFELMESLLLEKLPGMYGEKYLAPNAETQKIKGRIVKLEMKNGAEPVTIYALGRYFGSGHYMHHLHPYSRALVLNKTEGKTYTGVFNERFTILLTKVISSVIKKETVDGICAVPVKPGKTPRFDTMLSQISDQCGIENYGKNFRCNMVYPDQKPLSAENREKNVAGAFYYEGDLTEKTVILIDDIISTGSTVRECIRVLKSNGANRVIVLVLAVNQRGSYWSSEKPSISCPKCGHEMYLNVNGRGEFFYSCGNCYRNNQSTTLDYQIAWDQFVPKENKKITEFIDWSIED